MRQETLIIEDLMLLMLDDKLGAMAGANTMHYSLGGALLVDLAMLERITLDETRARWGATKIAATGNPALGDPLLQHAYDRIAQRPRDVTSVILEIGAGLYKPIIERLVERGFIRREKKRMLGFIPVTKLPAADSAHEDELLRKIRATLLDDEEPDTRTAAVIALVSASGILPTLHKDIPWSGKMYKRAKKFESGDWGAAAISTAVSRNVAAVAGASAAATAIVAIQNR